MPAKNTAETARQNGMDPLIYRENLLTERLTKKSDNWILGHFRCTTETRERFKADWKFITMLRDPVRRWVSHYHYDRYKASKYNKNELNINEYLDSDEGKRIGTLYLRHFSTYTEDMGIPTSEHVIEASQNLMAFDSCLFLEEIKESTTYIESVLGISFDMKKKNINSARKEVIKENMSAEVMEKVKDICKYDIEIYDEIKSR